jgi:hypothetical protein
MTNFKDRVTQLMNTDIYVVLFAGIGLKGQIIDVGEDAIEFTGATVEGGAADSIIPFNAIVRVTKVS